jgi:uncharacterized protein (TIGR00725 family)
VFYIAVVGGGCCTGADAAAAEAAGAAIARRGGVLVCGGGGGVMEAASKGARAAGGTTVGILPGESRRQGNQYLSLAVATGLGEARNAVIACACDVMIAVGGEYGTLSEIALALKMGKPVVGLQTWRVTPPRERQEGGGIVRAETPEAAVAIAWRLAGDQSGIQ